MSNNIVESFPCFTDSWGLLFECLASSRSDMRIWLATLSLFCCLSWFLLVLGGFVCGGLCVVHVWFFLIYFLFSLKAVQSVTKLVKVTGGSYRCSASLCATIISTCPSSALLFEKVLVDWIMKIQYFLDWLLLCVKLWLTPSNHVQLGCTLQLVNFRKLCHTECSDVKLTLLPLQKCGWYRGK